jgi:tRNA (mo5U34)-methyltransferase
MNRYMDVLAVEEHKERLQHILAGLDKNDIYRSIYDKDGNLLAEGCLAVKQQLIDSYCEIDFKGKSVVDLGCNFGFFSFLTARQGASAVTGLDYLPEVVEGAGHLASVLGYDNVFFKKFDIEKPTTDIGKFDIAMLLDFFGKSNIRKQKVHGLLEFLKTLSDNELLMAFRPINRIDKDLKLTEEKFCPLYPEKYIKNGNFYLVDYIRDNMAEDWDMAAVSDYKGEVSKDKLLFHFTRRQA